MAHSNNKTMKDKFERQIVSAFTVALVIIALLIGLSVSGQAQDNKDNFFNDDLIMYYGRKQAAIKYNEDMSNLWAKELAKSNVNNIVSFIENNPVFESTTSKDYKKAKAQPKQTIIVERSHTCTNSTPFGRTAPVITPIPKKSINLRITKVANTIWVRSSYW